MQRARCRLATAALGLLAACGPPGLEQAACWDQSRLPDTLADCPVGSWERVGGFSDTSTDPALTWQPLWGTDARTVWAVGPAGVLERWDGAGWTQAPESPRGIRGMWAATAEDLWVLTDAATQRWDGTQWNAAGGTVVRLHGVADDDIWRVLPTGRTEHFDGTTWTDRTGAAPWTDTPGVRFTSLWEHAERDVWLAAVLPGAAGQVRHVLYHFDGTSWVTQRDVAGPAGSSPPWAWVRTDGVVLALLQDRLVRLRAGAADCALDRDAHGVSLPSEGGTSTLLAFPAAVLVLDKAARWSCERSRLAAPDGEGGLDAVWSSGSNVAWGLRWPGPELYRRGR